MIEARHVKPSSAVTDPDQPTLLAALWSHPWTIAVFVTLFGALTILLDGLTPDRYEATAALIIEDPRAPALFDATELTKVSEQASERFLADQVEIIRSSIAAETASAILGGDPDPAEILENRVVQGEAASNLIQITFVARTPEDAKAGADALAQAYEDILAERVRVYADEALAQLDDLIVGVEADLEVLRGKIADRRSLDLATVEATKQFDESIVSLRELRALRDEAIPGSEARAALNAQIAELLQDFQTYEVVLRTNRNDTDLDALLQQRNALVTRLVELESRKEAIEVDASTAKGILLSSPALLPETSTRPALALLLAAATVLGFGVAVAVSYYLALRTRVVTDPVAPEAILGSPLLAEIPRFERGTGGAMPTATRPDSEAAESFRFASTAIDIRAGSRNIKSILFVAARSGRGTTSVVANTAYAAAASGLLVLAVDADFGTQSLSAQLLGSEVAGITDAVAGVVNLADAVQTVTLPGGIAIALLTRGLLDVDTPSLLRTSDAESFFSTLSDTFDMVFLDAPALTEVAYTTTLSRYVDAVVVIVDHGSDVADIEQMADRLELIGTPVLGYIYTKSTPSRRTLRNITSTVASAIRVEPRPLESPGQAESPEALAPTGHR